MTGSSTCRRTRTSGAASSTRPRDLEQNTSRPRGSSRRCGPLAFTASCSPRRARSTGSRTSSRRPRTRPFPSRPRSTEPRSSPAKGLIAAYASGFGFTGRHLPLCLHPRRALHPRSRLRLLPARFGMTRRRLARPRRRTSRRSPTSMSKTASPRCSRLVSQHEDEPGVSVYNLGPTRPSSSTNPAALISQPTWAAHRTVTSHRWQRAAGSATARSSVSTPRGSARLAGLRRSRSAKRLSAPLLWFDEHDDIVLWQAGPRGCHRCRDRSVSPMSVVFGRAPLRISLGGGGTDLPSYYCEHGGFLVAGAIDKYVYMFVHAVFQRRYRMKYSEIEEVDTIAEIRHPILRETLQRHWHGSPLEIASVADVPAGTGMGSSGAYTVCLLKSLAQARHTSVTPGSARRGRLPHRDRRAGRAGRQAGPVRRGARRDLRLHLQARRQRRGRAARARPRDPARAARAPPACSSPAIRARPRRCSPTRSVGRQQATRAMLANLHRTKEIGYLSRELLEKGDLDGLRRADARALGEQAQALAGHGERADRPPLFESRARAGRSAASSSGPGAEASCSSTRSTLRTPAWRMSRGRGAGADLRLRVRRRFRERVLMSSTQPAHLRVGIVGCGLIGRKRAEALGTRPTSSPASTSSPNGPVSLAADVRRHGLRHPSNELLAEQTRRRHRRDDPQ